MFRRAAHWLAGLTSALSGWTGRRARDPMMQWPGVDYASWIAQRVRQRRIDYPPPSLIAAPSFDILTLVHDTDPSILSRTAMSVRRQEYEHFQWIIWDNGSQRSQTRAVLTSLAGRPRVRILRSERNLGITVGHREALRHCNGAYIAFLDHDDVLYPDALRVAANFIQWNDGPAFLYSDEDKIDERNRPFCPFFKPAWSPALLQSTGYTCHLSIVRRELMERLELFANPVVEGAQDWDLALRVHDAGLAGIHIPEILYSWGIHSRSTSARGAAAKPYVLKGQQACLKASLERRGLEGRFRVQPNPIYPFVDGHWHLQWLGEPSDSVVVLREDAADPRPAAVRLNELLTASTAEFVGWIPTGQQLTSEAWLKEACGQLLLNPQAAIIGGRVLDANDCLVTGDQVFGMGQIMDTPFRGAAHDQVGYFGLSLCPRNVSAIHGVPWLARREVLANYRFDEQSFPRHFFDAELCLRMAKDDWEFAANPHIIAKLNAPVRHRRGQVEEGELLCARYTECEDDPYYSPFLSREPSRAYFIDASRRPVRRRTSRVLKREVAPCPCD